MADKSVPTPAMIREVVSSPGTMQEAVAKMLDMSLSEWPEPDRTMALAMAKSAFATFVTHVNEHAGSEIERMLYNSMLIGFAASDPFGIIVLPAQTDAQRAIRGRRDLVTSIYDVRKQMRASKSGKTVEGYIDWLEETGQVSHDGAEVYRAAEAFADLSGDAIHMIPQAGFPAGRLGQKAVRADALFFSPLRPKFRVVVECDGYEWHGNKDSFTADRVRDRVFKSAGYEVLRFSGSEIFANPTTASVELFERIRDLKKVARVDKKWREVTE